VAQQTSEDKSLRWPQIRAFKKHLFLCFIGNYKAYLTGRTKLACLEKLFKARTTSKGRMGTQKKTILLVVVKALENLLFSCEAHLTKKKIRFSNLYIFSKMMDLC
jgi:hypothetical protein